jgi:hypothetical protein
MSVQAQRFDFSERVLSERKRFMFIVTATMFVLALLVSLASVDFDMRRWTPGAPGLVIALSLGAVLTLFLITFRWNQWRQTRLYLDSTVRIHQSPRGETRAIDVFTTKGRPLTLFGFEPMAEVERLMRDGILSTITVEVVRSRLDWANPFVTVFGAAIAALVLEAQRRPGLTVSELIQASVHFAFGTYFLYGPVSRTNPGFRKAEIGLGVLFLASALFRVMSLLYQLAR